MSKTILIVDDSPTILAQLSSCLVPAGFRVLKASNGKEGLDVASKNPVDLAIIDVNMPIMTGIEMLAGLRKTPKGARMPVFVLTTESSQALRAEGKKLRATAWIVKPFKPPVLVGGVRKVLGVK